MSIINNNNACKLVVGVLDEKSIQLSGMFGIYRKMLLDDNTNRNNGREIEQFAELIKVELTPFILDYLQDVSKKQWGYEAFHHHPKEEFDGRNRFMSEDERDRRRMLETRPNPNDRRNY
jgi:hypothetical protein